MIPRTLAPYAREMSKRYPVVTIMGPRQSGKTTLCTMVFDEKPYVNLEDPGTRSFAAEDPQGFMNTYSHGAVLDEIQNAPQLLSYIQVVVDKAGRNGLFVLTGSQQPGLSDSISQSLAGRTALLRLLPFSLKELAHYGEFSTDTLLHRGFMPRIHQEQIPPDQAFGDYVETYVQRDVIAIARLRDTNVFHRFLRLAAGRTAQPLNLSGLSGDVGVSETTIREWVSILERCFVVFRLEPYYRNVRKRLARTPKLYFHDVGLAAWLCGIETERQIGAHPLRGNLFENMVVCELMKRRYNAGHRHNLHFYRDSSGKEVDVLYPAGGHRLPIEVKSAQTYNPSFLRGVAPYVSVAEAAPLKPLVLYDGPDGQNRTDVRIANFRSLDQVLEEYGV